MSGPIYEMWKKKDIEGLRRVAVEEKDKYKRRTAIQYLFEFKDVGVGPIVEIAMEDKNYEVRYTLEECLAKCDFLDVRVIVKSAFESKSKKKISVAVGVCIHRPSICKDFKQQLKNLSDDKDKLRRRGVVMAMASSRDKIFLDTLMKLILDPKPCVRGPAVFALALIGGPEVLKEVRNCLKDLEPYVRGFAARSLGFIGEKEDIDSLKKLLDDKHQLYDKESDMHEERTGRGDVTSEATLAIDNISRRLEGKPLDGNSAILNWPLSG